MLSQLPCYLDHSGDYLHTNTVNYIDAETATHFDFATAGQILLSMREPGMIVVLDPDTEKVVWAIRGPWVAQHDPDLLPNGHMLLFDNRGHYDSEGQDKSRVIEFDPHTYKIVWEYTGDDKKPLYSAARSAQERLPNGNTLITESEGGRLIEVTPNGEIVWEYVNPVRGGQQGKLLPIVSWGQRIDPQWLDEAFRRELSHRNSS
jgi:outer membrane protein assembly factor BamB